MNNDIGLVCLSCGTTYDQESIFSGCPRCFTYTYISNLTVQYNYENLKKTVSRQSFSNSRPGIWRFSNMLPITDSLHFLSIVECNTSLVPLPRVTREAQLKHIFTKAETRKPTLYERLEKIIELLS